MKTLSDIQKDLREILPQGIDLTFQALKGILPDGTDKYNDLILLEGRYMETSRMLLQGVISNETAQLEFNKIRKDLLDFIGSLQESHIRSEQTGGGDGRPDIYNGEVMYRIPRKMNHQEEVKCIVRLAFDRKAIMEGLDEEAGDVMKDIRISEVMGVELLDSGSGAFSIRTINDTVQLVEKDLYTEWIFYVMPLLPGIHPLVLKISVIEIRDGLERRRNVVLEEKVEIVTGQVVEGSTAEFTPAGYAIHLATGQEAAAPVPGSARNVKPVMPAPAPTVPPSTIVAPTPAPARPRGPAIRRLASALAALLVLVVASWAILRYLDPKNADAPFVSIEKDIRDEWQNVRITNTRKAYEDFLSDYPDSEFRQEAMSMLDSIETATWLAALASDDPAAIRAYLREYPDGRYAAEAIAYLDFGREDSVTIAEPEQEGNTKPATQPSSGPSRTPPPRRNNNNPQPQTGDTDITTSAPGGDEPPPKPEPTPDPNAPVPIAAAARKPVHPGCESSDRAKEEACTQDKIHRHVRRFLKYPREAERQRIEGTVMVGFVVERDGKITNVQARNDIGGGCAEEAVSIVQRLVPFKPGLDKDGKAVRIQYYLPIRFKLN